MKGVTIIRSSILVTTHNND